MAVPEQELFLRHAPFLGQVERGACASSWSEGACLPRTENRSREHVRPGCEPRLAFPAAVETGPDRTMFARSPGAVDPDAALEWKEHAETVPPRSHLCPVSERAEQGC